MDTKKRQILEWIGVSGLVGLGLWWRWQGIVANHSFWADEAFISGVARDWVTGWLSTKQALSMLSYQRLQVVITALFLKIMGTSELAARMPSVLWGTVGIWLAYVIGKKLSNWGGGFLAGFLYAFSQLNLAHSTQAKPYAGLETLFLIMIYLGLSKQIKRRYWWLIGVAMISTLLHVIGVISFVFVSGLFLLENKERLKNKYYWLWLGGMLGMAFWMAKTTINNVLLHIPLYNNTTYLRELLWKNYGFVLLPALFGGIISYQREKNVLISVLAWSVMLLGFWNFKSYSHNIRYVMPFFGLMLVFFGIFWAQVGAKFFGDKWGWSAVIVALILYGGGYKIVRKPLAYYNPNLDLYGDIQNADYKKMYAELKRRLPNYQQMVIFNDGPDTERWYMDRLANAYFRKDVEGVKTYRYGQERVPIYGSVEDFKKEKAKYKQGLVIVEDWQSFMPDDVKTYIKNNLQLELRMASLTQRGGSWPLAVYSWGIQ